jgi:hypothetical protein
LGEASPPRTAAESQVTHGRYGREAPAKMPHENTHGLRVQVAIIHAALANVQRGTKTEIRGGMIPSNNTIQINRWKVVLDTSD